MVSAGQRQDGKLPALRRGTFSVRQGRHTRRGKNLPDLSEGQPTNDPA
jgi:hypothetical protein